MFVIALILLGLHSFILVRNYRESKSNLVLTVSILLLINNFASISNVFLYNQMENNVGIVNADLNAALKWSRYFNFSMFTFVATLNNAHWFFFFTYLHCAATMRYFLEKKPVPVC